MFAKFFRPKWQSNKADVRIRAISSMLADDPEQQAILTRLAQNDQDAEVRRAAVTRVVSPDALLEIVRNDSDPGIRQLASEQLCRIITTEDGGLTLEQRLHCIEELQDQDLLTHISLNSQQAELQQAAVGRVRDESNLEVLVLNAQAAQTRRLAAQRLGSEAALERIARQVRQRDKAVYRILRDKLQTLREAAREQQELEARRRELVERFEQLARGELLPQYAARIDALQQEWDKLPAASDELRQRLEQALASCRARAEAVQAEKEARERQAQREAAHIRARDGLLGELETLERQSRHEASDGRLDPATLRQQLGEWQQRWQQLQAGGTTADTDQPATLARRLEQIDRLATTVGAEEQHRGELDDLLSRPVEDEAPGRLRQRQQRIEKLLQEIDWPEGLPRPERLQQAGKVLRLIEQHLQSLKRQSHEVRHALEEQLDSLESAISEGHVKQAGKLHQRAADTLEMLNGQAPAALDQRFRQLHAQLVELRDWQGFAVTPKKEQLCTEMEALVDSDLPAPEQADAVRRLQQQWKTLDSTDAYHSQSLWRRFKEASDRAYARCEDYYAAQAELRRENLRQRTIICDQIETYVGSIDWDAPDWKGIETICRAAKQEWKQYSPVDRGAGKAVQQRFNSLLQQLEGPMQAQFQQCLEAKRELVQAAAALCDAEDPQQAAAEAKQLQQRWKAAGKTFRSQEQRLWKQFRSHCDTIFERLNENREQHRRQQTEQRHDAETLCRQLEQLLETASGQAYIRAQLQQARSAFAALESEFSGPFARRFENAAQELEQECSELEQLRQNAGIRSLEARIAICDALEALLETAPDDTEPRARLQAQWDGETPCSGEFCELVEQRYQLLNQVLLEPELLPDLSDAAGEHLRQLCIQLEIELGLPSPDEDQALRLEYQMQRLQQALERHNQRASLSDLQHLEYEWRCIPLAGRHPQLRARFYGHLEGLL